MKKEKKAKHFRRKPQYPGGQQAMKDFLSKELKYPKEALEEKVEGSVMVQFTIDHLGLVAFTRIVSGIGYGCDEEAERVVKQLKFIADKNRGFKSNSTQTLGIHFRLPKKQQSESSISIEYSIRPEDNSQEKEDDPPSNAYQYTIEW
jgi:protein TonB